MSRLQRFGCRFRVGAVAGARIGAAALLLLFTASPAFARLEPPSVFHSPADDGTGSTGPTGISPVGARDLYLWLATGPDPSGPGQKVCENGLGDEICAFQVELQATAGLELEGFEPDPSVPGLPYVYSLDTQEDTLIVNRVNAGADPAGDFGAIRIGRLTVSTTGGGELRIESNSLSVNAEMGLGSIGGGTIAAPEPGGVAVWMAGLAGLSALRRRRVRRGRGRRAASLVLLAVCALHTSAPGAASASGLNTSHAELWMMSDLGGAGALPSPWEFGGVVVSGDFDGNGFDDLAIGAEEYNVDGVSNAGAVFVVYGRAGGLTSLDAQILSQNTPGVVDTAENSDAFGAALAACDANGDGYDDLIVGVPFEETTTPSNSGAIHVIYGSVAGLTGTPSDFLHQDTPGITNTNEVGDELGTAVACGKFNADDYDDVAIGVPGEDLTEQQAGMFLVVYGQDDFELDRDGEDVFSQGFNGLQGVEALNDRVGQHLAVGNFDNDAYMDLVVGVPNEDTDGDSNSGAVHVLYGTSGGISAGNDQYWHVDVSIGGDTVLGLTQPLANFGAAIAAGDFDDDGYDDLAVGSPGAPLSAGSQAGMLNVLRGSPGGLTPANDYTMSQGFNGLAGVEGAFDRFASALVVGDFDGDGIDDLAIGAPNDDVDGVSDAGSVHVVFGSSGGGLSTANDQFWSQLEPTIPDGADSFERLGTAVAAGDFDGDGIDDLAVGVRDELNESNGQSEGGVNVLYSTECANGLVEPGEECDDGNTVNGDGCSALCLLPDEVVIFGAAQGGGTVELQIEGVSIVVNTSFGDSEQDVIEGLVAAINADPTLAGLGVGAGVVGGKLVTDGRVELYTITDAGFSPREAIAAEPSLPALNRWEQITIDTEFAMPEPTVTPGPESLEAGDRFGHDVTPIGDLNGDGFIDVAVGAGGEDDAGNEAGAVWILFLAPSGLVLDVAKITGLVEMAGLVDAGDSFGRGLSAMDVDEDGRQELLVGATHAFDTDPSELHVLFLDELGQVASSQQIADTSTDAGFGIGVAALGDLDGLDASLDHWVAVGAPLDDTLGAEAGAVWLLSLDATGALEPGPEHKVKLTLPAEVEAGDQFGYDVASIGDLDRDGIQDLAVGAVGTLGDTNPEGVVFILFLNGDGSVREHVELASTMNANALFGSGLAWIPGLPGEPGGTLVVGGESFSPADVVNGRVDFLSLDETGQLIRSGGFLSTGLAAFGSGGKFDPEEEEDAARFGGGIAAIGDLNADGFQDVIATADAAEIELIQEVGAAYVLFLRRSDDSAFVDVIVAGDAEAVLPPRDNQTTVPRGEFIVQFVDNAVRGDGTQKADLILWRAATGGVTSDVFMRVWLSEDGISWTPAFSGYLTPNQDLEIDVDALNVGPTDRVRFVRVEQPPICEAEFPVICPTEPTVWSIEALTNLSLARDLDYDGLPDAEDNCPTVPNVLQGDRDGDGIGDYCDNCIDDANTEQGDADGDGRGDACDGPELELIPVGTALDPDYEVRLTCGGADPISEIGFGLRLPPGVPSSSAFFGGTSAANACENLGVIPLGVELPVGFVAESGCSAATELGATVAPAASSGVIVPPANDDPLGARGDTVYVRLVHNPLESDVICEPNENVFLGRFGFPPPVGSFSGPIITRQGVDTPGIQLPESSNIRGFRIAPRLSEPPPVVVDVELTVEPVEGQLEDQETRWRLLFDAREEIRRISIGLSVPPGTSTDDIRVLGCDTAPTGSELRRSCTGFGPDLTHVDPALTYTLGPDGSAPSPVMFVVVEATDEVDSASGEPALASPPGSPTPLGVIELGPSAGGFNELEGVAPELDLNGLEDLPDQPAITLSDSAQTAVSTADVTTINSYAAPEDSDRDGVRDESDRCPFYYSEATLDRGGLTSSVADGIGDPCQCAETDDTGKMLTNEADLQLMREAAVGLNEDVDVLARCSVSRGTECDVLDNALLQRALATGDPTLLEQVCTAAVPPPDGQP